MIKTKEAARQLGIHRETLLRAIREGRLEATQLGRGYQITEESIKAYLENQKVKVQHGN